MDDNDDVYKYQSSMERIYVQWPCTTRFVQSAYLSSAFNLETEKCSSQPTSTSTLTPPSSSSKDCEAGDGDWAPNNGVKLNMLPAVLARM